MYTGIITDIFDGIIARKLNVSTEKFRLLDTIFDLIFYFSILFFISKINPFALSKNLLLIVIILILESLMYIISLTRFRKLPSPHAILSKFWGLYLIIEFSLLIIGVSGYHFTIALLVGTIVHIDRVLIYICLRQWDHDIPSCYHAIQLRQGKTISRKKIFNG
jgi:CDP-diacylglycerol--glycerol-3-phosphate 3-phosphatidyltransferase